VVSGVVRTGVDLVERRSDVLDLGVVGVGGGG
jgi:hypothetical protein